MRVESENGTEVEETRLKGPLETNAYIQVRQIVPYDNTCRHLIKGSFLPFSIKLSQTHLCWYSAPLALLFQREFWLFFLHEVHCSWLWDYTSIPSLLEALSFQPSFTKQNWLVPGLLEPGASSARWSRLRVIILLQLWLPQPRMSVPPPPPAENLAHHLV